jgi:PleD family two-component response regulator
VTVSIGVVEYPTHGNTIDELVGKAERALKRAKDLGKNRTIVAE